ncbi:MAG: polysaccharide deacetylase family protein [Pseudomonadales bacterium]
MSKTRALFFRSINQLQTLGQPKLTTLIYHQVLPEADPLRPWEIDLNRFRQHMSWIANSYRVIPLSEAIQKLANGTLEKGCACITFDDGYRNNATVAASVLNEFGFNATFFCTSAYLDGDMMWNDKVIEAIRHWPHQRLSLEPLEITDLPVGTVEEKRSASLTVLNKLKYAEFSDRKIIADGLLKQSAASPERMMMNAEEILQLKGKGMTIGGHTHEHPILARLQPEQAAWQIQQNKELLENIIDEPIDLFAYPNGKPGVDYCQEHLQMVRDAGYRAAMSTSPGTAGKQADLFQIPRFTPWDKTATRFLTRLSLNFQTQPNLI